MAKKAKSLETKLRSALRLLWSRSAERRIVLKEATVDIKGIKTFTCPLCHTVWPIQMAEVDHIESLGTLELLKLTEWVQKLFYSPQRAICKLCHRKKSADDRRKMRKPK
jgi:hypothetical protein